MLPIHINPSSGVPIYRQIINQIRSLIAGGALKEGEQLPTVRELASFLQVNPMTISKAYLLLEAEKTAYRLTGKGVFISSSASVLKKKERLAILENLLEQVATESYQLDISPDETLKILSEKFSTITSRKKGEKK